MTRKMNGKLGIADEQTNGLIPVALRNPSINPFGGCNFNNKNREF